MSEVLASAPKQVAAATAPPVREIRGIRGELIANFEAHLAGGAGDYAEGGFVITSVDENDCAIQRVIG